MWRQNCKGQTFLLFLFSLDFSNSFQLNPSVLQTTAKYSSRTRNHHSRPFLFQKPHPQDVKNHITTTKLYQSFNNNNQFDMSKPTFDILSLRTIRNDALIQYSSTNQSEPLRINLYFLLACTCLAFPSISESVGIQLPENVPNLVLTLGSIGGAMVSALLFLRECKARSKQLNRIELEMNAEFLNVKVSPSLGGQVVSLQQLAKNQQKKIIAIAGSKENVREVLKEGMVLRRRLVQSNTLLVVLRVDISSNQKWDWDKEDAGMIGGRWFAEANDVSQWMDYFSGLAQNNQDNSNGDNNNLISPSDALLWFGLNANRRSFGSGMGISSLKFLELMGSFLRPTVVLNDDDPADTNSNTELLNSQQNFYKALTNGDEELMKTIWTTPSGNNGVDGAKEVTEVINSGGRIDDWKSCLMEGARPEGMMTADSDARIFSDTEAYTTTIEFPANTPMESGTLLAIQKWVRSDTTEPWALLLHQTIPWTAYSRASGTLRCDCRGCVALTRGPERRTFGGIIG